MPQSESDRAVEDLSGAHTDQGTRQDGQGRAVVTRLGRNAAAGDVGGAEVKKKFKAQLPKRKKSKLSRKRKQSTFDYASAKEGLGLDPKANFQQIWAATKAVTTPAPPVARKPPASPCKETLKAQLRMKADALSAIQKQLSKKRKGCIAEQQRADGGKVKNARLKRDVDKSKQELKQLEEKHKSLERDQEMNDRRHQEDLKQQSDNYRMQLRETEKAKSQQKKTMLREQGETNRHHRAQLKEIATMHTKEKESTEKQWEVVCEQERVNRNIKNMDRCKLDSLIVQLESEREDLLGKVTASESHCRELAEQLRLEKKASRIVITNAMSKAEDLMSEAEMIFKEANAKERTLRNMEHTSIKVNKDAHAKAVREGKQNVKKAVQQERRISARQRALGVYHFLMFAYLNEKRVLSPTTPIF